MSTHSIQEINKSVMTQFVWVLGQTCDKMFFGSQAFGRFIYGWAEWTFERLILQLFLFLCMLLDMSIDFALYLSFSFLKLRAKRTLLKVMVSAVFSLQSMTFNGFYTKREKSQLKGMIHTFRWGNGKKILIKRHDTIFYSRGNTVVRQPILGTGWSESRDFCIGSL